MKKVLYLVLTMLLLTGCGEKPVDNPNENQNNDSNKTPIASKTEVEVVDLESNSRPIAVMINNHKSAQKAQTGLNDAYLVYEFVVEGGITRMMALFKDADTAKIGTVRSSRHYYLDYALENDAIYVHFGWSEIAEQDIPKLKIDNVNGLYDGCFWRENPLNIAYEHTVYTNMEKLNKTIKNKGYRTTSNSDLLLDYNILDADLSKIDGSKKAANVKITYSDYQTNEFVYDEEAKVYHKYSNGELRKDLVSGEKFEVKNIITYQVKNYTITDKLQQLNNIGKGNGYYISNGYAVPITWEKDSRSSKTVYKYLNGEEIKVNDGITYIQVQPSGKNLEFN